MNNDTKPRPPTRINGKSNPAYYHWYKNTDMGKIAIHRKKMKNVERLISSGAYAESIISSMSDKEIYG